MAAGAANVTRGTVFAATLAAERTVLDVPPEVPGGTSMGQVSIAAEKVALGATKIQMCFSGGNDVPETVAVPLCKEFHTQIIAFLAFAVSSLGSNGATFDEGVVRATKLVSQSCANFVVVATATTTPSPNLKPSLAEVWSSCAAFKKLPKDGRAAVSKALMRSAAVVKDVVDELATIGDGADGADGENQSPTDDKPARHEDDLFFDDDDFEAEELQVAKACAQFAGAGFELLRALVAPIVRGTSTETQSLERALLECKKFQRAVEEVGAGSYPPQDLAEIAENALDALQRAQAMGTAIGEAGDLDAATTATTAFEVAHETLRLILREEER